MGKLIVIEGTDGSGKSTQFKRAFDFGKSSIQDPCISQIHGAKLCFDPDVSRR